MDERKAKEKTISREKLGQLYNELKRRKFRPLLE